MITPTKINFDILFPDEREKGENTFRQCQMVMLRLLKIFDFLCKKHGIEYFLTGGTLLGAIRHQGFIPWDDDIDVGMTRQNFKKFVEKAVPELPKEIFYQTEETDPFYPATSNVDARLRDKYSSYQQMDGSFKKCHEGLMLDIFVYDKSFLSHNFFVIATNKVLKYLLQSNQKRASVLEWIEKWVPLPMVYCSNYMQYFGQMRMGTYIKKKELKQYVRTPFEDMEALIPIGYDTYLRRQYGNYMELPPVEKRVSHHNVIANPFTPCEHSEILHWSNRLEIVNRSE